MQILVTSTTKATIDKTKLVYASALGKYRCQVHPYADYSDGVRVLYPREELIIRKCSICFVEERQSAKGIRKVIPLSVEEMHPEKVAPPIRARAEHGELFPAWFCPKCRQSSFGKDEQEDSFTACCGVAASHTQDLQTFWCQKCSGIRFYGEEELMLLAGTDCGCGGTLENISNRVGHA